MCERKSLVPRKGEEIQMLWALEIWGGGTRIQHEPTPPLPTHTPGPDVS